MNMVYLFIQDYQLILIVPICQDILSLGSVNQSQRHDHNNQFW